MSDDAAITRRRAAKFLSHTRRARGIADAYRRLYRTPDGKAVIDDILRDAGIFDVSTVRGDPYMTHFNDGRRAVGLGVIEKMRWSEPELIALAEERTRQDIEDAREVAA